MESTNFNNSLRHNFQTNFNTEDNDFRVSTDIPEENYSDDEPHSPQSPPDSATQSTAQIKISPKKTPVYVKKAVNQFRNIVQNPDNMGNSTLSPTSTQVMSKSLAKIQERAP